MKNSLLLIFISILIGLIIGYFLGRSNTFNISDLNIDIANCLYKGQTYKHGEGFKDECNSCSCQNGQVACTLMACE